MGHEDRIFHIHEYWFQFNSNFVELLYQVLDCAYNTGIVEIRTTKLTASQKSVEPRETRIISLKFKKGRNSNIDIKIGKVIKSFRMTLDFGFEY